MDVAIIGIGLHKFGRTDGVSGLDQGVVAARNALHDAGLDWSQVQYAFGGSTDAGNADSLVNSLGLTGLPFINVANGCATGGSALLSAFNAIKAGSCDVAMAVGFDKHPKGAFNPDPEDWGLQQWYGETGMMVTTQFFAMKIQRYMHMHGIENQTLAKVAEKNFYHGSLNENAWRRDPLNAEDIASSFMVSYPLTQYMFCSPGEGAAALILCSAEKAKQFTSNPVFLKAAAIRTRRFGSFEVFSPAQPVEEAPGPTVEASKAAFEMAGIGPDEIDVAQLQDTESGAEIMHMAENGFCQDGEQNEWIQSGATRLGGKLPVNTDGGCMANGEPIGASGLRQVYEICLQLRGEAGNRQVENAKTGYTHVYGAPGLSGVTVLSK